ncbi:MAG TPA: AAA family ATPase [Solirubrobacterales bacterium]
MPRERFRERVEQLLDDAREAAEGGDWPAVRALARSALALDPGERVAARLLEESGAGVDAGGEWRQLTVMFCDVVGSTALAGEHDPELYRQVLRSYQTVASATVRRYEGHVANYIGDGILAYFGHPTPHEDDARRAVKAGLDLLGAVGEVAREAERDHGFELAVRAAVHTGMVVRAEMGPPESPDRDAIVGETPNVAARLQERARSGMLVISGDTARLVSGYFALEPLGTVELRGVAEPVDAYAVTAETEPVGRPDTQRELSPFVGRERERERLDALWRGVTDGEGAVAAVGGEPGIGKSRLLDELGAGARASGGTVLACRCSAFHASTHLYPVRRMVAGACGIDLTAELEPTAVPLRAALARCGLEHHLPLFGSLLGIPPGPELPAPELDGVVLRETTLAALAEWIEAEAARAPSILTVDDLQWADPSTLELLGRLIERGVPGLFVLLGHRADFEPPWPAVEALELAPLGGEELRRIAAAAPEAERLAGDELERIVSRSDGVPFFLEELLRVSAQPAGAGSSLRLASKQTAIPPALLDPLLARLRAPGVDLGLIQTVACIGQEADYELLAAVTALPDEELQSGLDGLVAARLLARDRRQGTDYRFRHQLLRELAYDTQLTPARMQRHGRIAEALRRRAGSDQAAGAGRLAQHLELAGRGGDAILAYVEAARIAQSEGAFAEATEILDHALSLVPEIGDEQARPALELAIRRALGLVMMTTRGYAAPEAVHEYERCFELVQSLEAGPEHLADLIPVWSYYLLKGDLGRAEEVLAVAPQPLGGGLDEPPRELFTGFGHFFRGDVAAVVTDLGAYLDSDYARQPQVPLRWPLANDPTVAAGTLISIALYLGGDPSGARCAIEEGEARATALPFPWGPFSVAYAKAYGCLVGVLSGEYETADADIEAMLELADRHGFMFFTLFGQVQSEIARLRTGQAEGAEAVTQALALWRIAGGEMWIPAFLTEIATHQLGAGDTGGARASLREAEAICARTGARFWAAETERVHAEVKLAAGDAAGVDSLRAAAELAARQGALVFELRARTGLARAVGGRRERDELTALAARAGEGSDLPELAAARAALAGERSR